MGNRGDGMKQIVHTWVPHEGGTRYISLDECKLLPYWVELTFSLLFQDEDDWIGDTGKKVTFTFDAPIAVRYSDEAAREDLAKADFVDDFSVAKGRV